MKIPPFKAREVIRILTRLGFEQVRQRGSHGSSATRTVE